MISKLSALSLSIALTYTPVLAQIAPVPAPDPGPPSTSMLPNRIKINNSTFPPKAMGATAVEIDILGDGGGSTPSRFPGYAPGTVGTICGRNCGAFRVVVAYSHVAYDDPIVYPGQRGKSHLHTFFGNGDTSGVSTAASILNCSHSTSAGGLANCSAYWVPSVVYVCDTADKIAGIGTPHGLTCDPNRNGEVVRPTHLNVYYKGYFGVGEWDSGNLTTASWAINHDNQSLPPSFRMIAGSSASTAPQSIPDIGWACTLDTNNEEFGRYIPGTGNADSTSAAWWDRCHANLEPISTDSLRLTMRVPFPACRIDSNDLDSPTHNTHVAYAIQDDRVGAFTGDKRCPDGISHPMPGVTYHVIYPALHNDWPFWRLSSDRYATTSRGGWSVHGDWFNGWQQAIIDEWTFNCDVRGLDCHDHILGPNPAVTSDGYYASPCVPFSTPCTWRALRGPRRDR